MFAVAGGHWAILQSVAWSQMLVNYSKQEGSFWAGAEKTFSGEAPCSMCKKIAAAKKQEEKSPASVKVDKKSDTTVVKFSVFSHCLQRAIINLICSRVNFSPAQKLLLLQSQ